MTKIKIAHLYYDLMNLYGENGNIRALKKYIERQDIKTEIHFLTINDKINFNDYDIFYMGMGTEKSLFLVLEDILKYKSDIKNAIEKNKHFLITGNSIELFGEKIIDQNKQEHECLNIFPFITEHQDFRIVESVVYTTKLIKEKIIGFQNRNGLITGIDKPLFKVETGTGANLETKKEGYLYKNFYATYLIGPLFIRNPHLTNHIIKNVIKQKNKKYKLKIYNKTTEIKAYDTYLENFKSSRVENFMK